MEQTKKCIQCKACTRKCDMLRKYDLTLGDTDELEKLAYHCFLCGSCKEVCPVDIDGRDVFIEIRRNQVKENDCKIKEGGYDMLIKEKANYIFRNYKHVTSGRVLFTGCNFPSYFPKTTKYLADLLEKKAGIGTIYDCCGKPIAELGLEKEEQDIIDGLNRRLKKANVTEVIMLCPNCYYFLKDRLEVKVTGIFEVLKELEIGKSIAGEVNLFLPCPDKTEKNWLKELEYFLPDGKKVIDEVLCCGLGGCASAKEPEVSKGFTNTLKEKNYSEIYTYCASCAGKFTRDGMENAHHVLTEILGTKEKPDAAKSLLNRTMSKLW